MSRVVLGDAIFGGENVSRYEWQRGMFVRKILDAKRNFGGRTRKQKK